MDGIITVQDVYDSMPDSKKRVLHLLVGISLSRDSEQKLTGIDRIIYDSFSESESFITVYLIKQVLKDQND